MQILAAAYRALLIALVALIVAIVAIAVVFRYGLNTPLIFSFDLATILFVWLVFLGLAPAAHEGSHMAVDLFTAMLPAGAAKVLAVIMRLLMIAIALFLIRHSWDGDAHPHGDRLDADLDDLGLSGDAGRLRRLRRL